MCGEGAGAQGPGKGPLERRGKLETDWRDGITGSRKRVAGWRKGEKRRWVEGASKPGGLRASGGEGRDGDDMARLPA